MKRNRILLLLIAVLLCGCMPEQAVQPANDRLSQQVLSYTVCRSDAARVGLYISYLDLANFSFESLETMEEAIFTAAANAASLGCTDLFVQMRAFGDAAYPSQVYPSMQDTVLPGFDPALPFAETLLSHFQSRGVRVHAWVNPYRLYAGEGEEEEAFCTANADCIVSWDKGCYLRPDSKQSRELVLAGARELLELGFDGIHFDDYFYPTAEAAFDAEAYAVYLADGGQLPLADWRRDAVSALICSCRALVKEYGEERLFSVSPDGSPERDRELHCADVERWCAEGWLDLLCPQLYYGFENETMPFAETLQRWCGLCGQTPLLPVLSAYKVGAADLWAGDGSAEWTAAKDILARQCEQILAQPACAGLALYRYDSLFFPQHAQAVSAAAELEALKEALA